MRAYNTVAARAVLVQVLGLQDGGDCHSSHRAFANSVASSICHGECGQVMNVLMIGGEVFVWEEKKIG